MNGPDQRPEPGGYRFDLSPWRFPCLPFKPRGPPGSKAEKKDEMVIFHNPKILIVDDNPTDRLLVSEILKNHHVHS
jgi:hypothetical protein